MPPHQGSSSTPAAPTATPNTATTSWCPRRLKWLSRHAGFTTRRSRHGGRRSVRCQRRAGGPPGSCGRRARSAQSADSRRRSSSRSHSAAVIFGVLARSIPRDFSSASARSAAARLPAVRAYQAWYASALSVDGAHGSSRSCQRTQARGEYSKDKLRTGASPRAYPHGYVRSQRCASHHREAPKRRLSCVDDLHGRCLTTGDQRTREPSGRGFQPHPPHVVTCGFPLQRIPRAGCVLAV